MVILGGGSFKKMSSRFSPSQGQRSTTKYIKSLFPFVEIPTNYLTRELFISQYTNSTLV